MQIIFPLSKWIPASNGFHFRTPSAFYRRNEFPHPMGFIAERAQQLIRVWQHSADKCTREKRWMPASNAVHSRSATYAAAKSKNSQRKSDRESFPLKWTPASNGIHSGAPVETNVHRAAKAQSALPFGISLSEKASQPGIKVSKYRSSEMNSRVQWVSFSGNGRFMRAKVVIIVSSWWNHHVISIFPFKDLS